MNSFPVCELAKKWKDNFGYFEDHPIYPNRPGKEDKAFQEGARAALEYAMSCCLMGMPPTMIRVRLYNKVQEIDGKADGA